VSINTENDGEDDENLSALFGVTDGNRGSQSQQQVPDGGQPSREE
jgi:hypothetical protein